MLHNLFEFCWCNLKPHFCDFRTHFHFHEKPASQLTWHEHFCFRGILNGFTSDTLFLFSSFEIQRNFTKIYILSNYSSSYLADSCELYSPMPITHHQKLILTLDKELWLRFETSCNKSKNIQPKWSPPTPRQVPRLTSYGSESENLTIQHQPLTFPTCLRAGRS